MILDNDDSLNSENLVLIRICSDHTDTGSNRKS